MVWIKILIRRSGGVPGNDGTQKLSGGREFRYNPE